MKREPCSSSPVAEAFESHLQSAQGREVGVAPEFVAPGQQVSAVAHSTPGETDRALLIGHRPTASRAPLLAPGFRAARMFLLVMSIGRRLVRGGGIGSPIGGGHNCLGGSRVGFTFQRSGDPDRS
jgi:hypothetical protein